MSALEDPRPLDVLADFPAIPEGWAYLDTAATAQKPRPVIDAINRAYGETYATVHRGVYQRSADMTLAYEAARVKAAKFIGGKPDEPEGGPVARRRFLGALGTVVGLLFAMVIIAQSLPSFFFDPCWS